MPPATKTPPCGDHPMGPAVVRCAVCAWVLVELALPLVFLVMYGLFMRAIGRVANDHHGCEGALPRALGWGALWATAYVLPVALLTALLHAMRR